MKPQVYSLLLYNGDKNGKIDSVHRWSFSIRPELKICKVEMLDSELQVVKRMTMKNEEREVALFNIREFLFRKTSTPFAISKNVVWMITPSKFETDDQKHIKRLYLLEEL